MHNLINKFTSCQMNSFEKQSILPLISETNKNFEIQEEIFFLTTNKHHKIFIWECYKVPKYVSHSHTVLLNNVIQNLNSSRATFLDKINKTNQEQHYFMENI